MNSDIIWWVILIVDLIMLIISPAILISIIRNVFTKAIDTLSEDRKE